MIKRMFDITLTLLLLPIALPLMVLVFFLVLCAMGRPVFFTQERVGRDFASIRIPKFRTMTGGESIGRGYLEKSRITKTGRLLRTLHLDELPQLFLVLAGSMSFVGPRPLLEEHLRGFKNIKKRQSVLPGLTCYSQNKLFKEKFLDREEQIELDCKYVDNAGLFTDSGIILTTIWLYLRKVIEIKKDTH
ncbi:MAG: sugar transferase [bacterium]|nr:sugar transferase [bacterium]